MKFKTNKDGTVNIEGITTSQIIILINKIGKKGGGTTYTDEERIKLYKELMDLFANMP